MSTLNVDSIVSSVGGNTTTINGATPTVYNTMGRNRIINGDMRIDQRNAGAAVTHGGSQVYNVDRWLAQNSTDGTLTAQRVTDAPVGFTHSLKYTATATDTSLAAGQFTFTLQKIEGYNVADLSFGTASAQTITISFWTKSSLTGTFSGALCNLNFDRSYSFTYTINSANTWEYKTVTIPGDTIGTWQTDNTGSFQVIWSLGCGSTYTTTPNIWTAAGSLAAPGQVNVMNTLNATWQITGVQLEVGSVATEFERRPYGTELALCQRYFQRYTAQTTGATTDTGIAMLSNWNTTSAYTALLFQQTMRAAPTFSVSNVSHFTVLSGGNSWTPHALIVSGTGVNSVEFRANRDTGSWTSGYSSWLRITDTTGYIQLSSEL